MLILWPFIGELGTFGRPLSGSNPLSHWLVCFSVYVKEYVRTTRPNFTQYSVLVVYGHGSVVLW